MIPLHLSSPDGLLFGVCHPARQPDPRKTGVVLCYPLGHEYVRMHRFYLELAEGVARAGFTVLRFDYYGTGDSEGASGDVRLGQWNDNISLAVDYLQSQYQVRQVCLAGYGIGATLAALCASNRPDVRYLAMLEPEVAGRAYLARVRKAHEEWLRGSFAAKKTNAGGIEILGFPMSEQLHAEIERIDLSSTPPRALDFAFLMARVPYASGIEQYVHLLQGCGVETMVESMSDTDVWLKRVRAIVRWLEEKAP